MSYYRLYPSRNNTIFRYLRYTGKTVSGYTCQNINTGANSVMELMDGKGESKLIFWFEVNETIVNRIEKSSDYTVKLQLWDAGTLWEPAIKLKNLKLEYFTDIFSEGDGYSFLAPEAKDGFSNWSNRDSVNLWSGTSFTEIEQSPFTLNRINEDLNFNVTNDFKDVYVGSPSIGFCLSIDNRDNDENNIYRKFIHSIYTKTVFKPYLEFFFEDTITDNSYNCTVSNNKVYFINKAGVDFPENINFDMTGNTGTQTGTAVKEMPGVYSASINSNNFSYSTPFRKSIITVKWILSTSNKEIYRQNIEYKPDYILTDEYDINNLYFYPVTPSTHNTAKQGDILPFRVISEIRGEGTKVITTYEYRVTSMDGFEMVPWTKVSVYRDSMYFNIKTDYFFPEQQYEVWVRNKTDDSTITSNLTHKFKVTMNDKSHMRDMSASPYYSRDQFFSK